MRRKMVSGLLIAAMCMSLVACGEDKSINTSGGNGGTNNSSNNSGSANITTDGTSLDVNKEDMFTDRDKEIGYDSDNPITVNKENLTITEEGTFVLTGNIEGQVVVELADDGKTQMVLRDVTITNESSAAIYIKSGDKIFITLEGNNKIDTTGEFVAIDDNNIDGAIFSKSDITFNGEGSLEVVCEKGHGIVSKDDIKITSGTYKIDAALDGLNGKDSVRIADGNITIEAGTDAIQSSNDEDATKGYVYIEAGIFNLTSGGGSVNSSTSSGWGDWYGGDMGMGKPGYGNTSTSTDTSSAKGIKASSNIVISGGTFNIDSSDDSIHCNSSLQIEGGTINMSSGDDGIHADASVNILGGDITITKSYEAIEGNNITVAAGNLNLTASDDGFNAAGGNDMSGMGGRPGQGAFDTSTSSFLQIDGGTIIVNAAGDGLDSNGYLYVNGGTTYVFGPTNSGNGSMDYGISAIITGGTVVAIGSSGMAQNFSNGSSQGSILYNLQSSQAAGTTIALKDESGKVIVSVDSKKTFNSVVISAPEITSGGTYTLEVGIVSETINMTSNTYSNGGYGGMNPGGQGGMGPGGQGGMRPGR